MPNTRIPSPARSQGPPVTPRRYKTRTTRSVGSPARSTASGRLSNIVDQFKESNKDSFAVSPLSKTVLSDNTDIEMPRRKSWWRKVENSRDVIEVLDNEKPVDPPNVFEEFDVEVLTQEKKNYTIDLPDSSDNESIHSIEVPQRKLFVQKENLPHQKFGDVVGTSKSNKTHLEDKTINVGTKNLFAKTSVRSRPAFPSALLNFSGDKTIANKTKDLPVEVKAQPKGLFGRVATKRKNMFADFVVSESEDEIPEIKTKRFTFHKPSVPSRRSSNASSITTDIEMDDWKMLPSSTMVDHQLEAQLTTPEKKTRLSKLSEAKESTNTDSTKQSNKSMSSKNKSKLLTPAKNENAEISLSNKPKSPTKDDVTETLTQKVNAIQNKSKINLSKSKNMSQAQDVPVNEEVKETSNVKNKTYNINKTNPLSKSQIVENNVEENVDVQKSNLNIQKEMDMGEVKPAEEQQEKDEEIALTYEEDPEELQENNDEAKQVIDDKTKTICVDNRLSKVSEYMDNIEKELSKIVGAEMDHILQMETPMPNKSVHLTNKVVEETPDSKLKEHESSNTDTVANKLCENLKNQPLVKVVEKEVYNSQEKQNIACVQPLPTTSELKDHKEMQDNTSRHMPVNTKDDENINDNDQEVTSEDQIEASDQDKAEASQEIEASDQEGTEAEQELEIDEEEEEEQEQSYQEEDVEMSENQEDMEVNQGQEIEDNDEIDADKHIANEEVDKQNDAKKPVDVKIQNVSQKLEEEQCNEKADDYDDVIQDADEQNDENAEDNEIQDTDQQNASQDAEEEDDDEIEDTEEQSQEVEEEDEEQNASQEVEEEEEQVEDDEEQNTSQEVEEEQDEADDDEIQDVEDQNASQEVEEEQNNEADDEEIQASDNDNEEQEMEVDNSEEVAEEETEQQQSDVEIDGNVTHDTTGRNRKRRETNTPEAILHNATTEMDSFTTKGRNTSIRKTKSIIKNMTIRPSIAPPRESTGFSDGSKNSSAEGSGWDSHRTTRKTLRQTFGKDFTPRKSLRAMVMEKSAKRQTMINEANAQLKLHQATEFPDDDDQDEMIYEDNIEVESDHEVSKQTRQMKLDMFLEKIKKDNMKMKQKIEQQVKHSVKFDSVRVDALNFRPMAQIRRANTKSSIQPASKVKRIKPSLISSENLPPELVEAMKYKPPKRFKLGNVSWITKRLYKFLETKLEPRYDYKARVRAEKLVETIYNFVQSIKRLRVAPPHSVAELKREMARLDIVKTHFEFYHFFSNYMPSEVKIKVVPDIVNDIPLPQEGVFAAIVE